MCEVCNLFVAQDCLQPLSMQALPAQPESLCIVEMGGVEKQDELGEKGTIGFLYLNIGLQVLLCFLWGDNRNFKSLPSYWQNEKLRAFPCTFEQDVHLCCSRRALLGV